MEINNSWFWVVIFVIPKIDRLATETIMGIAEFKLLTCIAQNSQFLTDKQWGYIMNDNIPALSAFDGPINSRPIQILSFFLSRYNSRHGTHKGVTHVAIVSINYTTRKRSTQ